MTTQSSSNIADLLVIHFSACCEHCRQFLSTYGCTPLWIFYYCNHPLSTLLDCIIHWLILLSSNPLILTVTASLVLFINSTTWDALAKKNTVDLYQALRQHQHMFNYLSSRQKPTRMTNHSQAKRCLSYHHNHTDGTASINHESKTPWFHPQKWLKSRVDGLPSRIPPQRRGVIQVQALMKAHQYVPSFYHPWTLMLHGEAGHW